MSWRKSQYIWYIFLKNIHKLCKNTTNILTYIEIYIFIYIYLTYIEIYIDIYRNIILYKIYKMSFHIIYYDYDKMAELSNYLII